MRRSLVWFVCAGCVAAPVEVRPPDAVAVVERDPEGVLVVGDQCPAERSAEADGCPMPDEDGDGVGDARDECVEVQEARNGYRDGDGCPDEIPMDLQKFLGEIRGLDFELDKDVLKRRSLRVIDAAAAVLIKYPEIRIEISGHTDSTGSVEHNINLSRQRAETIRRLLSERGVDAARLTACGMGPNDPRCSRSHGCSNRRIEFNNADAYRYCDRDDE